MSTSSNESFVVISSEFGSEDSDPGKRILKPLVTFENVLDEYPLELDLLVRVKFDETYRPASEDTVVLVPVGWQSIQKAFCHGEKCNNNIVKFSLRELPRNDQLCQFCYYGGASPSVLGVSTIFQFKRYSKESLIEFIRCQDFADLLAKATAGGETQQSIHPVSTSAEKRVDDHWSRVNVHLAKMDSQQVKPDPDAMQASTSGISDTQQSARDVANEIASTVAKEWNHEKESLLKEMQELKVTVAKLQQKVDGNHDSSTSDSDSTPSTDDTPIIYGVTATYQRPQQFPLLMRLSHTLRLIPHFHWILVEDARSQNPDIYDMLKKSGLSFTYILAESSVTEKDNPDHREFVAQRNAAMKWLSDRDDTYGIVYFMDEAKIYSLEIFEEMRSIRTVGVWPVGLAGGLPAEKPILDVNGRVVGWNSTWRPDRRFPMDAIGFAINLDYLIQHPKARFSTVVQPALRLSHFLSLLVSVDQLEPKANRCTKVLVWYSSA